MIRLPWFGCQIIRELMDLKERREEKKNFPPNFWGLFLESEVMSGVSYLWGCPISHPDTRYGDQPLWFLSVPKISVYRQPASFWW